MPYRVAVKPIHDPLTQARRTTMAKSVNTARWALLAILTLVAVAPCAAYGLSAVGDSQDLWIIVPKTDSDRFTVWHRQIWDSPNQLRQALSMVGQLTTAGLASANSKLWLVYQGNDPPKHLTVQSIQAIPSTDIDPWRFEPKPHPPLPGGTSLRSLAANHKGLWALIRVNTPHALAQIDADPAPQHATGLSKQQTPADHTSETLAPIATDLQQAQPIPTDRLLWLNRNRWEKVDLPDDWQPGTPGWLVAQRTDSPMPLLVTRQPNHSNADIVTYRHEGQKWSRQPYTFPQADNRATNQPTPTTPTNPALFTPTPGTTPVVIAVNGQVVLGWGTRLSQQIELSLWALATQKALPLGTLTIDGPLSNTWAVAPAGQTAALIVRDADTDLSWTRIDLQGNTVTAPTPLIQHSGESLSDAADYVLVASVLVMAILIMFVFWRRDPASNQLALPKTTAVADLGTRATAGLIDLLPCVVAVTMTLDVPSKQITQHWPGHSTRFAEMLPAFITIGLFVLHTMITEMFTAQTLGKRIMGIKVTNLTGHPPHVWQVIARSVLKAFDLIAWPLLILPMIGPHRQRLGDLVAQTVVVTAQPPHHKDDNPPADADHDQSGD